MTDLIGTTFLCGCGVKERVCSCVYVCEEEWVSGEMSGAQDRLFGPHWLSLQTEFPVLYFIQTATRKVLEQVLGGL